MCQVDIRHFPYTLLMHACVQENPYEHLLCSQHHSGGCGHSSE